MLTQNGGDEERIVKATLLEEQACVGVEERKAGQLLGTGWQSGAKGSAGIGPLEASQIGCDNLGKGLVVQSLFLSQAPFLQYRVFDDGVLCFDVVILHTTVDTPQRLLASLVLIPLRIVGCKSVSLSGNNQWEE